MVKFFHEVRMTFRQLIQSHGIILPPILSPPKAYNSSGDFWSICVRRKTRMRCRQKILPTWMSWPEASIASATPKLGLNMFWSFTISKLLSISVGRLRLLKYTNSPKVDHNGSKVLVGLMSLSFKVDLEL